MLALHGCSSCVGLGQDAPDDVIPYGTAACGSTTGIKSAAAEAGEDFLDVLAGCVFGAIAAGQIAAAKVMVAKAGLSGEQAQLISDAIAKYYGVDTAHAVMAGATPWYKNWKIVVPAALGTAALVGLGVWALKKKKRRR